MGGRTRSARYPLYDMGAFPGLWLSSPPPVSPPDCRTMGSLAAHVAAKCCPVPGKARALVDPHSERLVAPAGSAPLDRFPLPASGWEPGCRTRRIVAPRSGVCPFHIGASDRHPNVCLLRLAPDPKSRVSKRCSRFPESSKVVLTVPTGGCSSAGTRKKAGRVRPCSVSVAECPTRGPGVSVRRRAARPLRPAGTRRRCPRGWRELPVE